MKPAVPCFWAPPYGGACYVQREAIIAATPMRDGRRYLLTVPGLTDKGDTSLYALAADMDWFLTGSEVEDVLDEAAASLSECKSA